MRCFGVMVLSFMLACGTAHAGLNFDFSFSNVNGTTSGTVTGEIFGLIDNSTSAATDLVIDSYPVGLTLPAVPWDIFNAAGYSIVNNSFTVSAGVVTAALFREDDSGLSGIDLNGGGLETNLQDFTFHEVENDLGFAGITFTPVSASTSTPEPASIALLLSGLFGLRLIRRRR